MFFILFLCYNCVWLRLLRRPVNYNHPRRSIFIKPSYFWLIFSQNGTTTTSSRSLGWFRNITVSEVYKWLLLFFYSFFFCLFCRPTSPFFVLLCWCWMNKTRPPSSFFIPHLLFVFLLRLFLVFLLCPRRVPIYVCLAYMVCWFALRCRCCCWFLDKILIF